MADFDQIRDNETVAENQARRDRFKPGGRIGQRGILPAGVKTRQVTDDAITSAKIEDLAVTSAKINDASITTAKIEDLAVTNAKVESLTATKLTAGTIAVGVNVGETNIKLDGANKNIVINDGTNPRILIGYQSGGF